MKPVLQRLVLGSVLVAATLLGPAPAAGDTPATTETPAATGTPVATETPTPDTHAWKCEQCPFPQGYTAEAEAGGLYASGANAASGRYTGIDHVGGYADARAAGQYRREDGSFANYDFERLGLASREGYVEGGREGRYDLSIRYDGQPARLYDTGATVFRGVGSSTLTLPANWVTAGSTAGMSTLGASLAPVKLEYDRRTTALLGRYFVSPTWTLHAELRREERDGTGLIDGSFLIQAAELPRPIDYATNSIEAGAAWAGRLASLQLTYTGSWFHDNLNSLTFANPYTPLLAGSTQGRLALPPSNNLQQFALSGNAQLPWFAAVLSYTASVGRLRQDDAFLRVSTLAGAAIPTPSSLNGEVRLSHYSASLAGRPLPKLTAHGSATYDGRNDRTTPLALAYVVTDTFPGGTAVTPRFGENRVRLEGGADYSLWRWLRVGVGGEFKHTSYSLGQYPTDVQETRSWGRVSLSPLAGLDFSLKGGNDERKASPFNAAALPVGENPLVIPYSFAPRDQFFFALNGSWAATATLTWAIEGFFANDDYRLSPLGLQSVHERRGSTTLTWAPRETFSVYVNGGYQRLDALQNGYTGAATAPWLTLDRERYWNAGAGGRWKLNERWTAALDYMHAPSYGDTDGLAGGLAQSFPENWNKLDLVQFDLRYRWSAALQVHFRYAHEGRNSNDWALGGVGPATIPGLLALGLQPYKANANLFGLTVRYQFGSASSGPAAQ